MAYSSAFYSTSEEVEELASTLTDQKAIYTTHLRSEFDPIIDAMKEAFEVGSKNDIPVIISHHKCAGAKNWGRTTETLALLDEIEKTQEVGCDCYPYSASSSTLDLKQVTSDFDIFITWSEPYPQYSRKTLKESRRK